MHSASARSASITRYWRAVSALLVFALLITSINSVAAVEPGAERFQRTWQRTDLPVGTGAVARTWMWGPEANYEVMQEPYVDAPGGERAVQYFDKARMEDNSFRAADAPWDVTNGLLVVELMTGAMQLGDNSFTKRLLAEVNVAGDADDPTGPTYATFGKLRDMAPRAIGATITERVDRDGSVTDDSSLAAQGVAVGYLDDVTNHAIAVPFWDFMNSSGLVYENDRLLNAPLFENAFFATGRPVTEAYWANVKVGGEYRDVLTQCFERRCLTYTPGNPEGFVVEAGNVGQHYYSWRYEQNPGDDPAPDPDPDPAPPTDELIFYRADTGGLNFSEVRSTGGTSTQATQTVDSGFNHMVAIDFNGDGQETLLLHRMADGYREYWEVSDDGELVQVGEGSNWTGGPWSHIVPIDVDADGNNELIFYQASSGKVNFSEVRSTGGTSTVATATLEKGFTHVVAIDRVGNGRQTLLFHRESDGYREYWVINDDQFVQVGTGNWTGGPWSHLLPADIDGDGNDELIFYQASSGKVNFSEVNPDGGTSTKDTATVDAGFTHVLAIDFTSDGKQTILFHREFDGYREYWQVSDEGELVKVADGNWTGGPWTHIVAIDAVAG